MTGSSQDSRSRWYFNVAVEVQCKPSPGTAAVGIDLGLKDCATVSTGQKMAVRWCRSHWLALGIEQWANKKKRCQLAHHRCKRADVLVFDA